MCILDLMEHDPGAQPFYDKNVNSLNQQRSDSYFWFDYVRKTFQTNEEDNTEQMLQAEVGKLGLLITFFVEPEKKATLLLQQLCLVSFLLFFTRRKISAKLHIFSSYVHVSLSSYDIQFDVYVVICVKYYCNYTLIARRSAHSLGQWFMFKDFD